MCQQIASVNECLKETPQKKSEAALFCDSLIPRLESFLEKNFDERELKLSNLFLKQFMETTDDRYLVIIGKPVLGQ